MSSNKIIAWPPSESADIMVNKWDKIERPFFHIFFNPINDKWIVRLTFAKADTFSSPMDSALVMDEEFSSSYSKEEIEERVIRMINRINEYGIYYAKECEEDSD